jgi:flavin reductase (DIM6/NTAB) family NADH-FMN oxidoreductase RutF
MYFAFLSRRASLMTRRELAPHWNCEPMARDCMPDDRAQAFREAMSRAAMGVAIVTTDGAGGRFGLTVSSVTSVSAEPPLVLVCVNTRTPVADAITTNGLLAINLLSTDQQDVADIFAGRGRCGSRYDFGCARWTSAATGAPLLDGAVAAFDCRLHHSIEAGTHKVLLGAVLSIRCRVAEPLVYSRRQYGRTTPLDPITACPMSLMRTTS